jgi:hypothetical protein
MAPPFDPDKEARNIAKHGKSLWLCPLVFADKVGEYEDTRFDYGEHRYVALGRISGRLHVCVYVWRDGERRYISLRKANEKEQRAWLP